MTNRKIAIIGGVGPHAGLDLAKKILDNTKAAKDSDHIPQIHVSFPEEIPDRTDFLMGKTKLNPADSIIKIINQIDCFQSGIVAIACNQVHSPSIFSKIKDNIPKEIQLVNMVEEVSDYIKTKYSNINKVALLGRNGTFYSNVYGISLEKRNIQLIDHSDFLQQMIDDSVGHPEYGIKYHNNPIMDKAKNDLFLALDFHNSSEAELVILGCTEIPLAIGSGSYKKLILLDATTVLARAMIRMYDKNKLLPEKF